MAAEKHVKNRKIRFTSPQTGIYSDCFRSQSPARFIDTSQAQQVRLYYRCCGNPSAVITHYFWIHPLHTVCTRLTPPGLGVESHPDKHWGSYKELWCPTSTKWRMGGGLSGLLEKEDKLQPSGSLIQHHQTSSSTDAGSLFIVTFGKVSNLA